MKVVGEGWILKHQERGRGRSFTPCRWLLLPRVTLPILTYPPAPAQTHLLLEAYRGVCPVPASSSPLNWELLEGRVGSYSRGIHRAGSANVHWSSEPAPALPPRPVRLHPLGFSSVNSASFSYFYPSSFFSFFSMCLLLSSSLLSIPTSHSFPRPTSPTPTTPRRPQPWAEQVQFLRRPTEGDVRHHWAAPLWRALPVRSGGRKPPGAAGSGRRRGWESRLQVSRRAGEGAHPSPQPGPGLGAGVGLQRLGLAAWAASLPPPAWNVRCAAGRARGWPTRRAAR